MRLILLLTLLTVAVVLWFFFPDSPVSAPFFTAEEKVLAVKRVAEGRVGVKNTQFKFYQAGPLLLTCEPSNCLTPRVGQACAC